MPTFNPQVQPTQPENYMGWYQPISTVPVNKSTGIALETAGNAVTGATSLADEIVKQVINSDVHKNVDAYRDQLTGQLENTANQLGIPNAGLGNTNAQAPLDLLPTNPNAPQSIPAGVTNGLNRIQSLQNGVNNGAGGKINDTLYSANITALAKQLRNQYPGYRDYIDAEVSKTSGLPVANAYYKNLMQDINSGLANQKALIDKPINQLATAAAQGVHIGNVQAADVYQAVLAGKITPQQGLSWLNGVKSVNFDFEQRAAARTDFKGSRDMLAITTADDANNYASATASKFFESAHLLSGQTPGQIVDAARRGTLNLSDSDAQKVGQVMEAQREAYVNAVWTKWQQDGTVTALGGPDKAQAILNQNAMQFDNVIQAVYKKDGGLALFHSQQNAAMLADSKNDLLKSGDLGRGAMNMNSLTELLGPTWAQTTVGNQLISSEIDSKYKTYAERQAAAAASGNPADIRYPPSFKNDVDTAIGKGIAPQSGYYKYMANLVNAMTDKNTPSTVKQNLANYYFGPNETGSLERLQRDSGVGRNQVVGADSAFMTMTSPAITAEMRKIGQVNPQLFQNYRNWAQDAFNTLTRDDVTTLAGLQGEGLQVRYNSDTHQFGILPGGLHGSLSPAALGMARQALNRLNMRMINLSQVEEGNGDVNDFLLQTLQSNGFDGSNGNKTVPGLMVQELGKAKLGNAMRK